MSDTPWEFFIHRVSGLFRNRRSELFRRTFPRFREMLGADVGGPIPFWEKIPADLLPRRLVVLNVGDNVTSRAYTDTIAHAEFVLYDGKRIPFDDREFDVAVCNSVLEHVPVAGRALLAGEIQRISKHYFVQTPAF